MVTNVVVLYNECLSLTVYISPPRLVLNDVYETARACCNFEVLFIYELYIPFIEITIMNPIIY